MLSDLFSVLGILNLLGLIDTMTYGATCHFIVPELDAGNQIIYQSTFTVPPGMKLADVVRLGQEDNEPHCLVEGVRRVVDREVELRLHRVVARPGRQK